MITTTKLNQQVIEIIIPLKIEKVDLFFFGPKEPKKKHTTPKHCTYLQNNQCIIYVVLY